MTSPYEGIDTRPTHAPPIDAILLVSFGGPEGPDDVLPFMQNVTAGRGIPEARLAEVSRHYLEHFGGVSPINDQARALKAALEGVLAEDGPGLPVYWGNRNWHPLLSDVLPQMAADGVRHALEVVTSAFPSYSGCRQYREDVWRNRGDVTVTKMRHYWAEDGFTAPMARAVQDALPSPEATVLFTAHSIPTSMNATSGPAGGAYEKALTEASSQVMAEVGQNPWQLVWQSRSGPPQVPWLEPDVGDRLEQLYADGVREVVMVPIGFTSDHVEVLYDLDIEAQARARATMPELVLTRAATVGTDPQFVRMLRDLVVERLEAPQELDEHGALATHDRCPGTCCPPPPRPAR